jgi:hypothetical protein
MLCLNQALDVRGSDVVAHHNVVSPAPFEVMNRAPGKAQVVVRGCGIPRTEVLERLPPARLREDKSRSRRPLHREIAFPLHGTFRNQGCNVRDASRPRNVAYRVPELTRVQSVQHSTAQGLAGIKRIGLAAGRLELLNSLLNWLIEIVVFPGPRSLQMGQDWR